MGGIFACSSVDVAFGSIDAISPLMITVTSGKVGDGGRNQALWVSTGSELTLSSSGSSSGDGTTDFSPPLFFFLFYLTLI